MSACVSGQYAFTETWTQHATETPPALLATLALRCRRSRSRTQGSGTHYRMGAVTKTL